MKQVVLRDGHANIVDVPSPALSVGQILVETAFSCISSGTEAATLQASDTSLVTDVASRPQLVGRALEIARTEGLQSLLSLYRERKQRWVETGYSLSGTVMAVGMGVTGFRTGDRVACAGAEWAHHAEVIRVPVNLAVKIPESVSNEAACTTTIGAIALQGVRRANLQIGETIAVIGLGLVGQLTVQIAKAAGARVIAHDLNPDRAKTAKSAGADIALSGPLIPSDRAFKKFSPAGVDAVVLTASTPSSDLVNDAFEICRKKGRVVVVGDVGMDLNRNAFYAKEIDFLISSSYGPGRYDLIYENEGIDYPAAFVRWTANRNMSAYLDLLALDKIAIELFESKSFSLEDAPTAFASLQQADPPLLITLAYPGHGTSKQADATVIRQYVHEPSNQTSIYALVGPGQFAMHTTLPHLAKRSDLLLKYVVGSNGAQTQRCADRFGSQIATTDAERMFRDEACPTVVITTRHENHGSLVLQALQHDKNVFVEKPLCLTREELNTISNHYAETEATDAPVLCVGFNRRFAPLIKHLAQFFSNRLAPLQIHYTMSVGPIPEDDWTMSAAGGGRNLGEACHIYDLFNHLTQSEHAEIRALPLARGETQSSDSNFLAYVRYRDGSVCTLEYHTSGELSFPKERLEVHCDSSSAVMENYRSITTWRHGKRQQMQLKQDKGHRELLMSFFDTLKKGGDWPIPLNQLLAATSVALDVQEQLTG